MTRTQHAAVWQRWLGWRYPHYDRMEDDAAATLLAGERAVVRVGFNGALRTPAEWHVTLFTPRRATPCSADTVAAASRMKPAGTVLHHVMTDAPTGEELTPADPLGVQIVVAVAAAGAAAHAARAASADLRTPRTVADRAAWRATERAADARSLVEAGVVAGLRARWGFPLVPAAVVKPAMLLDWRVYEFALALRARLEVRRSGEPSGWQPHGVRVCEACTIVFSTQRADARHCHLCRCRPAVPHVLGERPWTRGERQTVRAPQLVGSVITGWRSITLGVCDACGEPFMGRSDARSCRSCSNALRQRRHRAARRGRASG